jgi:uncharacterized membrane protein
VERISRNPVFNRNRRPDLLAVLFLALTCAGFYWRILFGGAWMPSGGGDLVSFLWPTYTFAARSLRSGVLPLWNPYLYGGMPFAADNQSGLFYPINLLVFFLVPNLTYFVMELMSVLHVWWAGVGMYILLRTMNARRVAAFASALAWMFSDRGLRVIAADLDPQSNLTAAFLDEDRLEKVMPSHRT